MNRRENLRSLLMGGLSIPFLTQCSASQLEHTQNDKNLQINYLSKENPFFIESQWHKMPDMDWAGPEYWGNRLQDWRIKEGKLECSYRGPNRTLHSLTCQLGNSRNIFKTSLHLTFPDVIPGSDDNQVGLLLGAKSSFQDYRASAVKGKGFPVGIYTSGKLFIGDEKDKEKPFTADQLQQGIILDVLAEPLGMKYKVTISIYDKNKGTKITDFTSYSVESSALEGNVALLSHWKKLPEKKSNKLAFKVDKWVLGGDKLQYNPSQTFGPISFTQYTTFGNVAKLTVQLMPVNLPSKVFLEIKKGDKWNKVDSSEVEYPSYTARFRLEDWSKETTPFRIGYDQIFTDNSSQHFYWEGEFVKEPLDKDDLKALICSCNFDYGFPDQEVVDYASMHEADVVMFLGDQFYEPNGGFGIQRAPLEKAYLDYLRKWYMFGWSYRELFRNKPTINLPDDHDVFQGNLFGAGGRQFPKVASNNFLRDHGGFMMPPEWVNLVMTTQTSHMPDPYDPEPAEQGIHVLYTDWKYGGVSFGIVEDRKFKSGPAAILPEEAEIRDAFVTNKNYDISKESFPNAELLGKRQEEFLEEWIEDWSNQTEFKVLVSASPFHALQTLPNGADSNGRQRRLYVPEAGEYVEGDVPVADTDTGGWPQSKRDKLLNIMRKGYVIHLAGDQHLPSVTQYGVNNWQDAGISFAVPALANSWPRRWWPPIPENHQPLPGEPKYTGNFKDAFGNKVHVKAVANPHKTGLEPSYLYDRSVGYGVVNFNKKDRQITIECWPRYVNPKTDPDKQFQGWPITVSQLDNLMPATPHFLPTLQFEGDSQPVIRVINENDSKLVQVLRIRGNTYQPRVEEAGLYTVEIIDTTRNISKDIKGLVAKLSNDGKEDVVF